MQHGRVMLASKLLANFRQRSRSELLHKKHGHLARKGDDLRVTTDLQILRAEAEMLTDALLDLVDGYLFFLRLDDVLKHLLRGTQVYLDTGERRVGHESDQSALQLAYIGLDGPSDVLGDVVGNMHALVLRFFLKNGDLCLKIGWLDIGDEAPFEARAQPLLDGGDFLRWAIRGDHDLFLLVVESVERVKKLFLGPLARGNELNVIHHEDVHVPEPVAEGGHAFEADRSDDLIREFLRADVGEAHGRVAPLERMTDRLHQMRFPETHPPIQEQWVIGFRRLLGYGGGRSVRKLVRGAHDERVKGVARVELMIRRIEVELRLRVSWRDRDDRFRFGANKFESELRASDLGQNGLKKFPIGFRQSLAEQPRGNANNQAVLFGPLLPCGTEPGEETVRIDTPLGVLKHFVPKVHQQNQPLTQFPPMWKCCGN